jgi:N-acetylglucosaminyldiphosphoundecaprenol N-acetyl-beta-D-mannosaminyltransferase
MKRASVLKTFITVGTYQDFIEAIFELVDKKIPSYVCFANVHMLIEAYQDEAFQNLVNNANLVAPDGRPLSIFLRLFKSMKQERVCGMDILPDLLQRAEVLNKSVYFYGTTVELLEAIIRKSKNEFPKLRIAGYYSPPFKSVLTEEETFAITAKIRATKPDLVFVALGCPKQEKWIAAMKNEINACFLGLGQAFHVYAGTETRLPKWMRNLSLEWLYRLYLEPGRLWKRYTYTNACFLLLTAKYLFSQIIKKFTSPSYK